MTTASENISRRFLEGDHTAYPMIAGDIIWPVTAVGLVNGTGHARPLEALDVFGGFATQKADNSGGIAAALDVSTRKRGAIRLPVTGAVITDVGNPVFASDDNTFSFSPVSGVYIGTFTKWESAGVGYVAFDTAWKDPYGGRVWETFSADATLTIQDTAKGLWVDTDTKTVLMLTYAAGTALDVLIMNGGAFGTIAVSVDVDGGDVMSGPGDTGSGGGITINTKTTARRGDFIQVATGGDDGYMIVKKKGIWTIA